MRIFAAPGYGRLANSLRFTFDDQGTVRSIRGSHDTVFRPLVVGTAALTGLHRVAAP